MKRAFKLIAPIACALLWTAPVAIAADGSDSGFNQMIGEMAGRDTGSGWFDYYVVTVNQEIAYKETGEPYGAAGPSGPLTGFDGYLSSFVPPDSGSMWFNEYVDSVAQDLKAKGY